MHSRLQHTNKEKQDNKQSGKTIILSINPIVFSSQFLFSSFLFDLWGYWHCGHSWPIVTASGDNENDCGEADGMYIGRGNRSSRRKPAPAPLLSITKSQKTRTGFEPGPPTTNRLSYGVDLLFSLRLSYCFAISPIIVLYHWPLPSRLSSTLKMKGAYSFEMLVPMWQNTRHHWACWCNGNVLDVYWAGSQFESRPQGTDYAGWGFL
jgi:hypothetical protein